MISRCAAEVDAWREVKDGWRPLYGDVDQFGVAVEWHDFRTERSFDWGRSFHPRSLEFCLNLQGHGAVGAIGRRQSDYLPGDSGYYAVGDEQLPASRRAHDHHQFVTLEFSRKHLQKQLVQNESDLEPEIQQEEAELLVDDRHHRLGLALVGTRLERDQPSHALVGQVREAPAQR